MSWDYDDDRPVSILLGADRKEMHRARKAHDCSRCSKGIQPRMVYRRRRFIVDGEPCTEKVCDYCLAEEYGGY